MLKQSLIISSISVAFFANAQDASVLRNSVEVYSAPWSGSAKYNAMAGSMGALGGDFSTLNSNPAGIGVAIASNLSATLSIDNMKNTSILYGNSISNQTNNTNLGQVGGIAVFETRANSPWKFVNIGVSYSNKSVDELSQSARNSNVTIPLTNGDVLSFNGHTYDRTGSITKMSLGVGGNYDNKIFIGAGLNLHGSSITQYDIASMTSQNAGTSSLFYKQYTPYAEDASGFSASVGIIGKVNKFFRLGAAIETPTWWSMDRIYTFYGYNSADDGEYSETRSLATPTKATLSAAYVPNKNFALNIDYTVGLSKPKFSDMSADAQTEMNNFLKANYKSISEVKIGAEYRYQQFRLRGGYGFASAPFDTMTMTTIGSNNANVDASFSSLYSGKRQTLGLGIGYDFKSFYADLAYNHITSDYNMPFLRGSATAGTEYYGNTAWFSNGSAVVSDVKNKFNNVSLTVGWKF